MPVVRFCQPRENAPQENASVARESPQHTKSFAGRLANIYNNHIANRHGGDGERTDYWELILWNRS